MTVPVRVGHYAWVKAWTPSDSGMPEHIRATAAVLFTYLAADGSAWPKQATIAERRGLSEDQVGKHMRWMADNGWLNYRRRVGRSSVSYVTVPGHLASVIDPSPSTEPNPSPSTGQPVTQHGSVPRSSTGQPVTQHGTEVPLEGPDKGQTVKRSPRTPVGPVGPRGPVGSESATGTQYGDPGWRGDANAVGVPEEYVWYPDAPQARPGVFGLWKRRLVETCALCLGTGDLDHDLYEQPIHPACYDEMMAEIAPKPRRKPRVIQAPDDEDDADLPVAALVNVSATRHKYRSAPAPDPEDALFEDEDDEEVSVARQRLDAEDARARARLAKSLAKLPITRKDRADAKMRAVLANLAPTPKPKSQMQSDYDDEAAWEAAGEMYGA